MPTNGLSARGVTYALMAGVALLLLPYVSGLIGSMVLYVVALPAVRYLDPDGRRRWLSLVVVLALFVLLVVPGAWLLAEVVAQLPAAVRSVSESAAVSRLMALRLGDLELGTYLRQGSTEIIAWSSRQTMAAIGGMLNGLLNLVIALFGAYYLLVSADRLWDRAQQSLPFRPAMSEVLRVRFHRTTEAMLLGVVLTGAAQGTLVSVVFWLIGLPNPLLWGGVTAFASLLPMFGSALVWFPAALVLLAQDRYLAAMLLLATGALVVSNIDNALRLIVYRRVSQIHPMVTLVGAFAGVRAFGLAGILIGPLLLSYMIELLRLHREPDWPALEAAA